MFSKALFITLSLAFIALASKWDQSPFGPTPEEIQVQKEERAKRDLQEQTKQQDESSAPQYSTITVAGVTWMAENMNTRSRSGVCYNNDNKNCLKFGRLYTWKEANAVCPEGWRLPTHDEFELLTTRASSEFENSVIFAGFRKFNGDFYDLNQTANFWTSEEDEDYKDYAEYWTFYKYNHLGGQWSKTRFYKDMAFSVRCVKDEANKAKVSRF